MAEQTAASDYGEDGSVKLWAHDDLLTRAEKIVYVLGYRGATAGFAVNVYRVLQRYEQLDAAARGNAARSTEQPPAEG